MEFIVIVHPDYEGARQELTYIFTIDNESEDPVSAKQILKGINAEGYFTEERTFTITADD